MENAHTSAPSLADRAKAILLKPKDEWSVIANEATSQTDIFKGYVLPLAAIAPIASFLRGQIFGYGGFLGVSVHPGFVSSLLSAIVSYVLAIIGVFVLAIIADVLAPKFDGKSDRLAAFRLTAYSATAAWIAGIFNLVPMLTVFSLLGFYSIYLFYTGAGTLLQVPAARVGSYTIVWLLCAVAVFVVIGFIASRFVSPQPMDLVSERSGSDASITVPGVGTIDTGKIEEAANRAEKIRSGELKPVPATELKNLLPASISGFERTKTSTQAMGAAGAGAEGKYESGDYSFDLRVNDITAAAGLAGIGAAMGIEHTEESDDGYERIGVVDGHWHNEKWDNNRRTGTYGIVVADRFHIEASGHVADIDVLKNAVATVDRSDLENLTD